MNCPPDRELLPPEIPFAGLIPIIHRLHAIYQNNEARGLGLTAGQFPFLFHIAHRPDITQDEIAEQAHIDKGTVARAVKKLEDGGFVRRSPDPRNRRRYFLALTKKGNATLPAIIEIERAWENLISAGLSEAERARLHEDVYRLAKNSIEQIRICGEVEVDHDVA